MAVHSTEVVLEHMVELIGWLARNDTEVQRTKDEVLTMKDEKGAPGRYGFSVVGVVICMGWPLHALLV